MGPGGLEKLQRHKVSARELDFEPEFNMFRFSVIFEVQISKLFSKKSNPCGPSGQIPRGKRILYRSSPCQVFVTFCEKYWFFTSEIPLFHRDPVSSVRPSEASSDRFLCVHPRPRGLLDFRLLDFPEWPSPWGALEGHP